MKSRVPVSPSSDPLQSPFLELHIEGLPDGPAPVADPPTEERKPRKHRVVLRREKSARGGKTVVVITQLPTHLSPPELDNLLSEARKSLGCGGALKGRELEIQGDQPARVRAWLEQKGFAVVGP